LRTATPNEINARNRSVIAEFRANGGHLDGRMAGTPLLLLHTVGARTGRQRVNPLVYQDLGHGAIAVFAVNEGAHIHPDWYRNLLANSDVTAEIGATVGSFRARTASGVERERIWANHRATVPAIDDMQARTERTIPVVVLEPVEPDHS
jgi:deazaflavin-dependent oxidoreductase (nitroreductase family)